jgi:hypothetical protein
MMGINGLAPDSKQLMFRAQAQPVGSDRVPQEQHLCRSAIDQPCYHCMTMIVQVADFFAVRTGERHSHQLH